MVVFFLLLMFNFVNCIAFGFFMVVVFFCFFSSPFVVNRDVLVFLFIAMSILFTLFLSL